MHQDNRLVRIDEHSLELPHPHDFPIRLIATQEVPLQTKAVDELLRVTQLADTVNTIQNYDTEFFGDRSPEIEKITITPDFHKGAGIPIGTVLSTSGFTVPQAIGNDVNCGMRLMTTPLGRDQVEPALDKIIAHTRHIFFEGGRAVPMTPGQREALVLRGLPGLLELASETGNTGIWQQIDAEREIASLDRIHAGGGFETDSTFALQDYLTLGKEASYDNLIGGLGGGNHFAEVQYVKKIHDGQTAHAWGLTEGQIVFMVHCGSLGLGHIAGKWFLEKIKQSFPTGLSHPGNGIYPLPVDGPLQDLSRQFMISMKNAANFAFGNRFILAEMLRKAFIKELGQFDTETVYDAPHNLLWETGDNRFIHRKGASPAHGWEAMENTPFAAWGEPVIVPGSMGASSWLLAGRGSAEATYSSCHGAGRALSRGEAAQVDDEQLDEFLKAFRVVTPVDPNRPDIKQQANVLKAWRDSLKKEAPFAYKSITPVIDTLKQANIAQPVAELFPLMTVKG